MLQFLKITVLGGILFLVPIIILITIIGKALQITGRLAVPVVGLLGVESIGGVAVLGLVAVGILVVICFLAGLAAKTPRAKKFVQHLENNVLEKIPAYSLLKARTQSSLSLEATEGMRAAVIRFDDSWQLAFEIERSQSGRVVLYLPGAPDPWSGSVCAVDSDRVAYLDVSVSSAANLMKRIGKGGALVFSNSPD